MMFFPSLNRRRNRALVGYLEPYMKDRDVVLDYGCGDGELMIHLQRACGENRKAIKVTGYDPVERAVSFRRWVTIFNSLVRLPKISYSVCLLVDVVHHMGERKKAASSDVYDSVGEEFGKAISFLSPHARILIKDYVISPSPFLAFSQRSFLAFKDSITNPKEVNKSFAYFTLHQWYQLFSKFNLRLITVQDVPYLPLERVYQSIAGKPVLFLLERNHSRPSRSCFPQP